MVGTPQHTQHKLVVTGGLQAALLDIVMVMPSIPASKISISGLTSFSQINAAQLLQELR